jgi:hypothetical protein
MDHAVHAHLSHLGSLSPDYGRVGNESRACPGPAAKRRCGSWRLQRARRTHLHRSPRYPRTESERVAQSRNPLRASDHAPGSRRASIHGLSRNAPR